jgi:hypothetical protein
MMQFSPRSNISCKLDAIDKGKTPDCLRIQHKNLGIHLQTSQKSSRMPSVARSGFPKDFFNLRSRRGSLTNKEKVNLGTNLQSSADQGNWRDICDFDSCLPPTSELLRKNQFHAIPAEQS